MNQARPQALLISPAFFGYERDIVEEFERQGFATTFVDERPSNSAIIRAVARVRKGLISRRIQSYYRSQQAELAGTSFELVVVIKAEVVPRWFLEAIREQSPHARFVFYTFDAIGNASNCTAVLDCFDYLLSFDPDDVVKRSEFSYLPLFYTPDFTPLSSIETERTRRFSLSFIGTLHSERYSFAKTLFAGRPRTFGFFFVQAKWYFAIVKYLTREHSAVPWSDVSFASLNRQQIAEIFRESHAVLDMQRPGQAGLTMRTFEVLASGTILVTTNDAIKSEPFFDPARIVIASADIHDLEAAGIQDQLASMESPTGAPTGFEDYSLEAWVRALTNPSEAEGSAP